ncbi:MAG TPA: S-layer homology domain-containing protein, partial [Symbiobacteriaceae bacterium]|nr:S-layer homology domain-containing protein [Symbiobacteriaceae bacterium]
MFRRVWAGFLSLVLIMGMVAVAPVTVSAAMAEEDYSAAALQLNKYGLVQGDDRGYRFYAQITRAEMAKLLVYALGLQNDAPRYVGRGVFSDTQGHWADGVVTLAKNVGVMKGYPEGNFRPQAPVTYAEVITALSRLVGLEAGAEEWPRTYLQPAARAGIIPAQMNVQATLNDSANRGDVFVLLWRTLTEVRNAQGQNLLRRYLDTSAPALTVDPQPAETTDPTLAVSGTARDADQVLVNGKAAQVSFGTFRQDVSLRVGPNTIRVQAVDSAGNVREETIQITRKLGPVNTVSMMGPAQVQAGQTVAFTLTIQDENGTPVTDRKAVTADVAPSTLGTFDPATGIFTAGTAVGSGTITVKAGAALSRLAVAVVGGPLDRIQVTPSLAEVAAKESVQFAATGLDAYGNTVPVGTVQWAASSGSISSTGAYTAPDRAGSYTVTATAGGKTATATVQPPNFKAGSVRISQPATSMRANGISELILTATVLDATGNTLTAYAGSLTLSSLNPGVALPTQTTVPVTGGVAQFTVRAGTMAGATQISAATNLTVSGSTTVTTTPQHLQSVRLVGTALSNHFGNRGTGYVEAIALDEDGNPMRTTLSDTVAIRLRATTSGGAGNVTFTQNGQAEAIIALGPVDPASGDVRSRTNLQYDAGVGTMLIEGTPMGTTSWVQVLSGALRADQVGMPARVTIEPMVDAEAGTPADIYVLVLDENGYRVTQAANLANVVVKLKDESGIYYPAADNSNGRWHFRVTQNVAGAHTYTAQIQPARAETTYQATVLPGPVDHVTLTADPAVILADNASQTTLTAELRDAFENRITDRPYRVTFRQVVSMGATQPFTDRVLQLDKGQAKITIRAATAVNQDRYTAIVDNPAGGNWTSLPAVITTRGVPERLALRYGNNDGNQTPGEATDNVGQVGRQVAIFVDVVDRTGGVATYDSGRSISLSARNMETGKETNIPAVKTTDGVAAFFVTLPEAGTYALKAQATNLAASVTVGYGGGIGNLTIQPAQQLRIRVAADLTELRPNANANGSGPNFALITATLVDVNGVPQLNLTGGTLTVLLNIVADNLGTFTTSTGVPTTLSSLEIAPNLSTSTTPVKFFSGTATGAKLVTWTTQDGVTSSFSIATVYAATEHNLTVVAEPASVGADQTVTVTVRSADGKRLSSANGVIVLKMMDADTAALDPADGTFKGTVLIQADRGQAVFRVQAGNSGA